MGKSGVKNEKPKAKTRNQEKLFQPHKKEIHYIPMRKIKNPWMQKEGYDCFGCCPDNPLGVHMEFYEDGDDIVSFWNPKTHYQGWINTMHGGILSTLIDETAAWTVFRKLQTSGVTTHLEVRYKKPVMTTDPQITLRAHISETRRHLAIIDITLENSKGEICTEGRATYFVFDKQRAAEMGFTACELEGEELLPM